MFALVADGKNGFRVVQMISPENVPENAGFSPKPAPILIATYPVEDAQAIGRGLDRDRVVDETGSQTVVFGRRGSRPFNLNEMLPFLRHGDVNGEGKDPHRTGAWYHVEDVVVKKDKDGKQTLLTKSGATLSAPVAFVNPAGTPTPVLGAPMMSPNGAPVPMPVPGSYPPLPEQGSEFMNGQDVQRLLRTMDPTRPPDQPPGMVPVPPASPAPSPAGPANPFLQPGAVERLEHVKEQAPPAASPDAMTTPESLATPTPSKPVVPSGNPYLQDNAADRLSRLRQTPAPAASPVPTGSPK